MMVFDYTETLRFDSSKTLDESIECLSRKTYQSYWEVYLSGTVPDSYMIGSIEADKVRLSRMRAKTYISPTPLFKGRFIKAGNTFVLEGKFTTYPILKIFFSIYLSVLFIFALLSIFLILPGSENRFAGIVMLCFCAVPFLLLIVAKKISSRNVVYISNEIKAALN